MIPLRDHFDLKREPMTKGEMERPAGKRENGKGTDREFDQGYD